MLSSFLQRERDELLSRLRPGTPQTETFRRAIEGCFDLADTAASQKRNLSFEQGMTAAERKAEMAKLVDDRLFPRLAALTQPARKARAQFQAERAKYQSGYLPKEVSDLVNDVGCVEAAAYFAQTELKPSSAMGEYEFQLLMTSGSGR